MDTHPVTTSRSPPPVHTRCCCCWHNIGEHGGEDKEGFPAVTWQYYIWASVKIESFLCAMIMINRSKYLTKTFIEINGILDTDRRYWWCWYEECPHHQVLCTLNVSTHPPAQPQQRHAAWEWRGHVTRDTWPMGTQNMDTVTQDNNQLITENWEHFTVYWIRIPSYVSIVWRWLVRPTS